MYRTPPRGRHSADENIEESDKGAAGRVHGFKYFPDKNKFGQVPHNQNSEQLRPGNRNEPMINNITDSSRKDRNSGKSTTNGHENIIREKKEENAFCISIASLLSQFSNVKVRGDYLTGKFQLEGTPQLLDQLDELRCLLQPRWLGGGFMANIPRCCDAVEHYSLLNQESDKILKLQTRPHYSYRMWTDFLTKLAEDSYWSDTNPMDRCIHGARGTKTDSQSGNSGKKSKVKKEIRTSSPINSITTKSDGSSRISKTSSKHSARSLRQKKLKVEEIIILDDSRVSDTSISSTSSSSSSSSGRTRHVSRRSRNRTKTYKHSVVTPPAFEMDGRVTFEDFLKSYEKFFEKKYGNTDKYDMSQVLGTLLKGEMLKIFEIRGGRNVKYSSMKKYLLSYYKDKCVGTKKYWREKLETLSPEPEEPFDIFGLRLLEVAKMAYSKKNEAAEAVRKPFLRQMPSHVRSRITDAELLNAAQGHGNFLPFKALMTLAKRVQAEGGKPKSVMWSSTVPNSGSTIANDSESNEDKKSGAPQKERTYKNRKLSNSPPSRSNQSRSISCHHCRNRGHKRSECWIRQGLCRICGGRHKMEECPRYDPDYRSKSRPRRNYNNNNPLN